MRQIASPRGNLIEKILKDSNGKLVRVTFCVYEVNGHIKARVVSAVPVIEVASNESNLALYGVTSAQSISEIISYEHSFVSPYFNSATIQLVGSKPRAPTFIFK